MIAKRDQAMLLGNSVEERQLIRDIRLQVRVDKKK